MYSNETGAPEKNQTGKTIVHKKFLLARTQTKIIVLMVQQLTAFCIYPRRTIAEKREIISHAPFHTHAWILPIAVCIVHPPIYVCILIHNNIISTHWQYKRPHIHSHRFALQHITSARIVCNLFTFVLPVQYSLFVDTNTDSRMATACRPKRSALPRQHEKMNNDNKNQQKPISNYTRFDDNMDIYINEYIFMRRTEKQ